MGYPVGPELELFIVKTYLVFKTLTVAPPNHGRSVFGAVIDMLIGNTPKRGVCSDQSYFAVIDDIERSVFHIGGIDSVIGSAGFVLHQHKSVFRSCRFCPGRFGYLPGRRLGGVSAWNVCRRAGAEQKRQCQQNK